MALIEIDGLPHLKMGGLSMAMLNNQMVFEFIPTIQLLMKLGMVDTSAVLTL